MCWRRMPCKDTAHGKAIEIKEIRNWGSDGSDPAWSVALFGNNTHFLQQKQRFSDCGAAGMKCIGKESFRRKRRTRRKISFGNHLENLVRRLHILQSANAGRKRFVCDRHCSDPVDDIKWFFFNIMFGLGINGQYVFSSILRNMTYCVWLWINPII